MGCKAQHQSVQILVLLSVWVRFPGMSGRMWRLVSFHCSSLPKLGRPLCWFQEIQIFTMYTCIPLDSNLLLDIGVAYWLQICIVNPMGLGDVVIYIFTTRFIKPSYRWVLWFMLCRSCIHTNVQIMSRRNCSKAPVTEEIDYITLNSIVEDALNNCAYIYI